MSEPWTAPGLTVEERADALHREVAEALGEEPLTYGAPECIAAALRAAIEDAALLAEAMAFDAIAARIRALKGG